MKNFLGLVGKLIFYVLVVTCTASFLFAQNYSHKIEVRPIEELKSQLIVFDNYYNSYVPLIDYNSKKYQSVHLWLDLVKYRGNYLEFYASEGLALFVNGKFFKKYNQSGKERILIKSFQSFSNGSFVFLSYYHESSRWPKSIKVSVATMMYQIDSSEESKILPYIKNRFNDFVVEALLLVLGFIALVKVFFRKTFYSYYTFLNYLRMRNVSLQEDILVMNVLNKESIIYVILNSVMMSYSFVLMLNFFKLSILVGNIRPSEYWMMFAVGILLCLLIYLLKYIGVYTNALIYKFKNITNTHFFAFVSYWQKIGLLMFVFSIFFCSTLSVFNIEISTYWFNFYLVIIIILLCINVAFHIRYFLSFTNVYLFSYLCITEVLPIMLLYKLYTNTELILK